MDVPQPPTTDPPKKPAIWTSITTFMRQLQGRVQHEWHQIRRGSRYSTRGEGDGCLPIVLIVGCVLVCWAAYKIYMWLVEIVRYGIEKAAHFLMDATPVMLLVVIAVVVYACLNRRS